MDPILTELALIRTMAGRSQQDIADATGLHQGTISAWETGRRPPSLDKLRLYLDELGLDLAIVPKEPR